MKKMILLALIGMPLMLFGQFTVDGVSINDLAEVNYVSTTAIKSGVSTYYKVTFDYGQNVKDNKDFTVIAEGEKVRFNSGVHLIHFMEENGWELMNDNVVVFSAGARPTYFYLFKRK
ncbi:MAG: hypothetical protein R2788_13910 [Saprospiraceae bacterium]